MLFKEVYQVVENPQNKMSIEIISGWVRLVYQYDVQFVDEPQMNFKRTIRRLPKDVEPSDNAIEELLNNSELNNLMGRYTCRTHTRTNQTRGKRVQE